MADAWEYKIIKGDAYDNDDELSHKAKCIEVINELNEAGSEGWEAFATTSNQYGDCDLILLKRSMGKISYACGYREVI